MGVGVGYGGWGWLVERKGLRGGIGGSLHANDKGVHAL